MGRNARRKQERKFEKGFERKDSHIIGRFQKLSQERLFEKFDETGGWEFRLNRKRNPQLALLWLDTVQFAESLRLAVQLMFGMSGGRKQFQSAVQADVEKFLRAFTRQFRDCLGSIDLQASDVYFWITRLKGVFESAISPTLFILLGFPLSNFRLYDFKLDEKVPITMEIALAYGSGCIIYSGKWLIVHKGIDSIEGQGELMIAVKQDDGCWSHLPHNIKQYPPLSEYKQAKKALKQYSLPIEGELVHHRSAKLAKLLGLSVNENYAYLIK